MEKLFYWDLNELFNDVNETKFATYESKENDDNYEFKLNVAGLSKKDIDLSVEDNLLVIKSNNEEIKLSKKYILPKNINEDKISAEVKHGLLKVVIPKKEKMKIVIE